MPKDKFFAGFVGYGQLTKADTDFLKVDFDRERQQGPEYVGIFNVVTSKRPDLKSTTRK